MSIERSVGIALLAAIACGCGGDLDESSTVISDDGKSHPIADVYGPSSDTSVGLSADWRLLQTDAWSGTTDTLLRFGTDGHLEVTATNTKVTVLSGRGTTCEIANHWRTVEPHRFGVLFACDDGRNREAVFWFPAWVHSFPPEDKPNAGMSLDLALETVAGEPVGAPGAEHVWGPYLFRLAGATE